MLDLVIKNARIVDGTGGPAFDGDVGIEGGRVAGVGTVSDPAARTIDAEGHLLTPGFVDIHTHFDGQVCWDKEVTPSCWHGVTTVVMGNCGVGFAPVRPGTEDALVKLMESVEDIPGSALHEGISWNWESFAEYLDAIDTPYAMDIGTQVPHVALRHYVMGERCYDAATPDDMKAMAALTEDALKAGALGFSTSRFYGHLDSAGNLIPGTHASAEEMKTIAGAFKAVEHGTIEIISDYLQDDEEIAWIESILRDTGRTVTTLTTAGPSRIWAESERLAAEGLQLRPQVGARPASILMTLEGTINPMKIYPAYREIMRRPLQEQVQILQDPTFRERVKTEEPIVYRNADAQRFVTDFAHMYRMDTLSYEPSSALNSVAAIARREDRHPLDVVMDVMADTTPLLFFFGRYQDNLDEQKAAIEHPCSVFGLSDGGAHVGVLCDASMPTYMLTYFARDRRRGETLPLEFVVHKMTQDTARVYGLEDRGVIAPGYKADLNLIDFEALTLDKPEMVYDLPAGGKRLLQTAQGYLLTFCSGEITYQNGRHTGAKPGRLIRGGAAL
jgi:N-acyl-D-aspartate/D-glutamate deacylase